MTPEDLIKIGLFLANELEVPANAEVVIVGRGMRVGVYPRRQDVIDSMRIATPIPRTENGTSIDMARIDLNIFDMGDFRAAAGYSKSANILAINIAPWLTDR